MARATAAQDQPNATTANGASGSGKTPSHAMSNPMVEMSKLMVVAVKADNQEEVNAKLTQLREEMAQIQRQIDAEKTRMADHQVQIDEEVERLKLEAWRLDRQQVASAAVYQRRCQSRVPPNLNPTRMFSSPQTPGANHHPPRQSSSQVEIVQQPMQPPLNPQAAQHFQTPQGYFFNPMDNVLAATRHLESLPIRGNTVVELEARSAIEMLKMAVVHQAQFSYSGDRVESTLQASHSKSRPDVPPKVSSNVRRHQPQINPLEPPSSNAKVAEIIHSSDDITAAQAVLILEKNYHFHPLVLKLGRLKRKVQDMGELMDTLTRYAESDGTKDAGSDDEKASEVKRGDGAKGHFQTFGCNNNQGGQGKTRQQDGVSNFFANTNAGPRNQRQDMSQGGFQDRCFSGRKPRNYEELLKEPCPKHSTPGAPSTHSWENYFVMQEFCLQVSQDHQGGNEGAQQGQFGPGGSQGVLFSDVPNPGPQG
ncbi:hypothetical protein ZWY2020_035844 [Hordeum vulgare]|nr:hypothetical protein ZWY2020_035844 [Hordeum vulgare]